MSRRRRPSRAPWILALLLALALAGAAATLYRIYPEYQRLRTAQETAQPPTGSTPHPTSGTPAPQPLVVHLYFARIVEGKLRMVAVSRELPSGLSPAQAALEELIRGEVPRGCERPLPPGTKLRSITVAAGVALADFSAELRSAFPGGSDNEGVTIYSIVNTLTKLPGIDKVQILIEGESVNDIGGHIDIREPLSHDDELVVPHT